MQGGRASFVPAPGEFSIQVVRQEGIDRLVRLKLHMVLSFQKRTLRPSSGNSSEDAAYVRVKKFWLSNWLAFAAV
jgi:hypothetical protein